MPRHQSRISFAVNRGGPAEQSQRSTSFSKSGIETKKVVPKPVNKSISAQDTDEREFQSKVDSQTLDEMLHSREARQLLATLRKDRITTSKKADSIPPGERALHIFDVSMKYGPAQGLSRLDRWNRADKLGKRPPSYIKTILEAAKRSPNYEHYEMSIFGQLQ